MRRFFTTFSLLLTFGLGLLPLAPVSAQNIHNAGQNLDVIAQKAGTNQGDITQIVGQVINAVLSLVGLIFLILMVYAGILWMTARGEESQIEKAQKIIEACLIGIVLTVAAYAITVFVTNRFEK